VSQGGLLLGGIRGPGFERTKVANLVGWFRANGINGWPVASFDGGDQMSAAAITGFADSTQFYVLRTGSDVTSAVTFGSCETSQHTSFVQSGTVRQNGGSVVNTALAVAVSTTYYVTTQFNQAASFGRVNGSQSGNANAGSNSATILRLGNGGGVSWNGLIAEALFCNAAVDAATIAYVEAYLKAKYRL
jgi:hypothetical protein